MTDPMRDRIEAQIVWLTAERARVKREANESGFDATSAIAPIVRRYRKDLTDQIKALRAQLPETDASFLGRIFEIDSHEYS